MSYQVLARKWRPRDFSEMIGQEHVLRALINALDHDRLHHAFLFTGTRGVGKTTIARILAKSLNCETGVSSKPCGQCSACREIDEGRFVDLIEVDAASRTKVEDTRELLDNVQYAPSRGRYKVYLIDEVHMLSNHSFNALLKTLEEPPPHVKFLLATTDPQKLPVTILSRCLQFNLRRLPAERIRDHLAHIVKEEGIPAEAAALAHLARAADGSMRDALSLLDQAIAFGGGQVNEADVQAMLGSIEHGHVLALLHALADNDANAVLQQVRELAEQAPDFGGVLAELLTSLHHIALLQVSPESYDESMGDREALLSLGKALAPEDVQLFYQIGVIGRRDLPLAPDARGGLEMTLLRMLAFRPARTDAAAPASTGGTAQPRSAGAGGTTQPPATTRATKAAVPTPPFEGSMATTAPMPGVTTPVPAVVIAPEDAQDWPNLVAQLNLVGVVQQMALNMALLRREGQTWCFALDPSCGQLLTKAREQRLQESLSEKLGTPVTLRIDVVAPPAETPAGRDERMRGERQADAVVQIENDSNVKALRETFNARIKPDSIRPLD